MHRLLQLVVASTMALVVFAILVHPVFDGPDATLRLERLTILFLAVMTAIIALGINGGAYAIEIIRGGVQSINKGQVEAGLALGLHKAQVFRLIVLKPALRAIYPSLESQFVLLTLTTSVAAAISAYELTSVAQRIESDSFRSFEVYGTVTLFYFVMSWLVMSLFRIIGKVSFDYPIK